MTGYSHVLCVYYFQAACRAIESAVLQGYTTIELRTDSTYTIKCNELCIMEPPNNIGHFGTGHFVFFKWCPLLGGCPFLRGSFIGGSCKYSNLQHIIHKDVQYEDSKVLRAVSLSFKLVKVSSMR